LASISLRFILAFFFSTKPIYPFCLVPVIGDGPASFSLLIEAGASELGIAFGSFFSTLPSLGKLIDLSSPLPDRNFFFPLSRLWESLRRHSLLGSPPPRSFFFPAAMLPGVCSRRLPPPLRERSPSLSGGEGDCGLFLSCFSCRQTSVSPFGAQERHVFFFRLVFSPPQGYGSRIFAYILRVGRFRPSPREIFISIQYASLAFPGCAFFL